ncbi:hypothetical protein [Rhizobium sp. RU36D]|uniref:hypothetical protein n=1 Tax=Rhizobium sp. RU36D TaxID=1907415 RepID=UPI001179AABA|nr:hypothetical protein [Rhizobium sp. RU36D]
MQQETDGDSRRQAADKVTFRHAGLDPASSSGASAPQEEFIAIKDLIALEAGSEAGGKCFAYRRSGTSLNDFFASGLSVRITRREAP